MTVTSEQQDEFESLARPIIEWLNNNSHPHVMVVITPVNAQLFEGVCATGTVLDYLQD